MDNWEQLFTVEETAEIEAFLRTTNWGVDIRGNVRSLLFYLKRYASTVTSAEGCPDGLLDEYRNYLGARDCLEEIMLGVGPELRAKIARVVAPLDDRFRAATVLASRPLFHRVKSEDWWYWRMPRNRGPELDEDFTNEGIRPAE